MGYNPEVHHRRSIRLSSWDYRDRGAYFFTICTYRRASLFENEYFSRIVEQVWQHVLRAGLHLGADQFTVARDHVHGIVWIDRANAVAVGARHARSPNSEANCGRHSGRQASLVSGCASPLRDASGQSPRPLPASLGTAVGSFKSAASRRVNEIRRTPGAPVWQRGYYERILRDDRELHRARTYVLRHGFNKREDGDGAIAIDTA